MCLALPCADRNLLDAIQRERFAGINKVQVMSIVHDIALSIKEMHDHHLVHGDIKVLFPPPLFPSCHCFCGFSHADL